MKWSFNSVCMRVSFSYLNLQLRIFFAFVILQVGTLKICTQVMKIVSFYSLFGTIQSALLAAFLERDPNAWRLDFNFELLVIVLTVRDILSNNLNCSSFDTI